MADQRRCCILGACCPPLSQDQKDALASWLCDKLTGVPLVPEDTKHTICKTLAESLINDGLIRTI